jgi:hypothetical protein
MERGVAREIMNSRWSSCAAVFVLIVAGAIEVRAQENAVRPTPNPYQEDVSYRIGDELDPGVEVSGVRWNHVQVAPREGEDPEPEQEVTVNVDLRFDNSGRKGATLIVVLLLEDGDGAELYRLAPPEMRLGGNKVKEFRHKLEVPRRALLDTRRMYLFFRVQN